MAWIVKRLLLVTGLYSTLRLFFFIWNYRDYRDVETTKILLAFVHGVRFDLSATLTISLPFILLWCLLPRLHSWDRFRVTDRIFWLLHFAFIVANMGDVELAQFNGQRLTWNYLSLASDISRQSGQIIVNYWRQSLLLAIMGVILWKYLPKPTAVQLSILRRVSISVLVVAFSTLGIRGGTQNKPLRPAHAYNSGKVELGTLTLNSTFTVIHSRKAKQQEHYRFFSDDEACALAKPTVQNHLNVPWRRPQNVIIFIMESFAREYMGKINGRAGFTPFLDELAEKGIFMTEGFANGRRSIEAIPSITASVPSLMSEPFLMSGYQGVKIGGLPQKLRAGGYGTAFFHGAVNGSMFFDSFAARIGYERYFGRNEYPEPEKDDDGFWGILDEPYFQYFASELGQMRAPFFATIFSLSSHQPYPVPEQYRAELPKGDLEIHQSIAYADLALRKFFDRAKHEPWFNDTLFVFTGDHTQKSSDPNYQTEMGWYRVPVIFYHPTFKWPELDQARPTQHADIEASILDFLNIADQTERLVGSSIFGPREEALVVNRTVDGFWSKTGDGSVHLDLAGNVRFSEGADASVRTKAFVQCFISRVLDGNLDGQHAKVSKHTAGE